MLDYLLLKKYFKNYLHLFSTMYCIVYIFNIYLCIVMLRVLNSSKYNKAP